MKQSNDNIENRWSGQCIRQSEWLRAGLSGDRIPRGGVIFRTCPDRPWGPPSLLYNGYRVFPVGKIRPGRDADPSPPSSVVVMKWQSYTSTPHVGRTACTESQCLYKGVLYFFTSGIELATSRACLNQLRHRVSPHIKNHWAVFLRDASRLTTLTRLHNLLTFEVNCGLGSGSDLIRSDKLEDIFHSFS